MSKPSDLAQGTTRLGRRQLENEADNSATLFSAISRVVKLKKA